MNNKEFLPSNRIKTSDYSNDQIDIKDIYDLLIRQKRILISTLALSLITAVPIAFLQKPTWEGEFQIVLETEQSNKGSLNNLIGSNQIVKSLSSGLVNESNNLKTEVKILESPSVLKPVYNFVKSYKIKNNKDFNSSYKNWFNESLTIRLEKDTSVLNISYRDKNKDLILNVLNLISEKYQDYSGKDRKRGLNQGIAYLETQLKIIKEQTNKSINTLQLFSIENGLGSVVRYGIPSASNSSFSFNNKSSTNNRYQKPKNSSQNPINNRYEPNFNRLAELESELIEKSAVLKDSSKVIISLKKRINTLKNSLTRPKEVLIKYRELRREALRDENILEGIETELESLKLSRARSTNPWELISKPTLNDSKIEPNERKIITISFLIGLILGVSIAYLKEQLSGYAYSKKIIESLLPYKYIKTLNIKSKENLDRSLSMILDGPLKINSNEKIGLLPTSLNFEDEIQILINSIKKYIPENNIIIAKTSSDLDQCTKKVIITQLGKTKINELKNLIEDLIIKNEQLEGWILIDSYID